MGIDRRAADQVLVELERAEAVEQLTGGRGDLRADPVAGKNDDSKGHGGSRTVPLALTHALSLSVAGVEPAQETVALQRRVLAGDAL